MANKSSKDVSVLLGREDGTFRDPLRFPVGGRGPDALFVGDFNGDGNLDLGTIAFVSNEVFVLLGNGNGTFQRSELVAVGQQAQPPITDRIAADDREGLLIGGPAGLAIRQIGGVDGSTPTFSFSSLSQAAAISLSSSDGEPAVYSAGEGQESSVLLTSFGIAVPMARSEGQHSWLADVIVVNGPGFTTGVDVFAQRDESLSYCDDGLAGHESEPLRQFPGILLSDRRGHAGAQIDRPVFPAPEQTDESALNSFRMVVDEVLGPSRLDGLPGRAAQPRGAPPRTSNGQADQGKPPDHQGAAQPDDVFQEMTANPGESLARPLVAALLASSLGSGSKETEEYPGDD
jgi:hypothetical protein